MTVSSLRKKKSLRRWLLLPAWGCMVAAACCYFYNFRFFQVDDTNFDQAINAAAAKHGLDPLLVRSVVYEESRFNPREVGKAGEIGLMQIMPNTCEWIGWRLGENVEHERMRDPAWNIRYGCYLLSYYYGKYEDWDLVLCAYNAGDGNVDKWLADPALSQDGRLMEIPFGETKRYLGRVKEAAREYAELYPEIMQSNRNAVT